MLTWFDTLKLSHISNCNNGSIEFASNFANNSEYNISAQSFTVPSVLIFHDTTNIILWKKNLVILLPFQNENQKTWMKLNI